MSKGNTITLIEENREVYAGLELIDFEKSYENWRLGDEATKNNISINTRSLDRLDTDYELCFAKPVSRRNEDSVRVGSWFDFSISDCMINFEAVLISYLGIGNILMNSNHHYGNQTGQVMSIALGRYLKPGNRSWDGVFLSRQSLIEAGEARNQ